MTTFQFNGLEMLEHIFPDDWTDYTKFPSLKNLAFYILLSDETGVVVGACVSGADGGLNEQLAKQETEIRMKILLNQIETIENQTSGAVGPKKE